jgi:hypothetical protein
MSAAVFGSVMEPKKVTWSNSSGLTSGRVKFAATHNDQWQEKSEGAAGRGDVALEGCMAELFWADLRLQLLVALITSITW